MRQIVQVLALGLALVPACEPAGANEAIGPGGGIVTSADGRLTIAVPRGALQDDVVITIGRTEEREGVCYELGPRGTDFRVPVEVTLDAPVDYHFNVLAIGEGAAGRICTNGSTG